MKLATATRTDLATAFLTDINLGFIKIYDGPQPANPDTAVGGTNHLLGTLPLNTPAGTELNGVITIDVTNVQDASADLGGTPTFVRILKTDGTTPVADCTAGVGSGEFSFSSTIVLGGVIPLTSASFTVPLGT